MNCDGNVTVELSIREIRALRTFASFMVGTLEEAGCDLTDAEFPDGTIGPSPLMTGAMKLELVLTLEGAEL